MSRTTTSTTAEMRALPQREISFLLNDCFGLPALLQHERFAHIDEAVIAEVLETAEKLAERYFLPCRQLLDEQEPALHNQRVELPQMLKDACRAFADAGLLRAHLPESEGGLQLPWSVSTAAMGYFQAANISATAYLTLTIGAANLLNKHGTVEQKCQWMEPLYEGRYFGTMALSEPQAGSSLADIRTLATPRDDGSHALTGTKQWISAGEHELAENIVHLLLARTPDAPPGVHGISLFIVPRLRPGADGAFEDNDVRLVSLLHKMGYRGITSTILALGSDNNCRGWLVGEEGQGLAYMFNMMNEARIGVGMGAAALACAGFRYSLDYATSRKQGRRPDAKDPSQPMLPIIEHADVRHMLFTQKVYSEGALALGLFCASLLDMQAVASDKDQRRDLALLLDLLTPVAKAWSSDYGLEANSLAIQILGGYGYTRDYPVEQFYRDNRLNPIHEGTNGIQAIDLLGRKVVQADGRAMRLLKERIKTTLDEAATVEILADCREALAAAVDRLDATTSRLVELGAEQGREHMLANASLYLKCFGHTVVAWLWLQQALAACKLRDAGGKDAQNAYYRGKVDACHYFYRYQLPQTRFWAEQLQQADNLVLESDPEGF